jgi:hypothetical protein
MPTSIKPGINTAMQRLRLDDSLIDDVRSAIDEAYAETLTQLDRVALHVDAAALAAAIAPAQAALTAAELTQNADLIAAAQAELDRVSTGMVVTDDLITAQLLLVDVRVGSNSGDDVARKQRAADVMLYRHRRLGV